MKLIQLCTGLLRRDDRLLLVRCRYAGEPKPLWVLPGGRHEEGETIPDTIVREFLEETGLHVQPEALAYASESVDDRRGLHVVNCTFFVSEHDPAAPLHPNDPSVVEARFIPVLQAPAFLSADVLRIPVAAALSGRAHPPYFVFDANTVAVPFLTGPPGAQDI